MTQLLSTALRWLVQKLGLLLLIVAVLLVASWLKAEWDEHSAIAREIAQQEELLANLRSELQSIDDELARESIAWRSRMEAATEPLRSRVRALDARLEAAAARLDDARTRFADLDRHARSARAAARDAKAELDRLERTTWWWDQYLAPSKIVARERARARYVALDKTARAAEAASRQAATRAAAIRHQSSRLQSERATLARDIDITTRSDSPKTKQLQATRAQREQEAQSIEQLLEAQRDRSARDPRERLISRVKDKLPLALAILVGLLLLPVLVKLLLYFAVAPLASRLPPIRILPDSAAPAIPEPLRSSVSATIDVPPGDELLVQPEYLQSSSLPARKVTRWFLNPRLPFASLASGMFALTSVKPEGDAPTRVVVSSQKDPFGEVGVVEIPEHAAMVVQPRALAGIVKPDTRAAHITRHWRLASLHAWLTLQLRYLVFHGPCRLVLKGCRGVRAEEPRAEQPRIVNQAATLGFSANLAYQTTRTETFVPYLRGQVDLFDDQFAGGPGRFVYEEVPGGGRRGGVTGRGFEGLVDAFLKALGI